MKHTIIYTALSSIFFTACSFSAGAKKDFATGLSYSYKGCTVQDVMLVDAQEIPLTNNVIKLNSSFAIAASGVQNFQLTGGKAYPGCELTIKDTLNKVLAYAPDILEARVKDGIVTPGPLNLSAAFSFFQPFTHGETCIVIARFFDKQNPNKEITASVKVLLD